MQKIPVSRGRFIKDYLHRGCPVAYHHRCRHRITSPRNRQQFVRGRVLHVGDLSGDGENEIGQGTLRPCAVHEVVDLALEDAEQRVPFEVPAEDDKVSGDGVTLITLERAIFRRLFVRGARKFVQEPGVLQ